MTPPPAGRTGKSLNCLLHGLFRLLRNKDRGPELGVGRYFWKISIGTTILHLRGTPSFDGGSSHSNVSATTGSCMILSSGCMSRWGRQPAGNVVPELPLFAFGPREFSYYNREMSGNGLFGFPFLPWIAEVLVGLLRGEPLTDLVLV